MKTLYSLAILLSLATGANAQFIAGGGSGNGLTWCVGQIAAATVKSADGSLIMTQGTLQSPAVPYASICVPEVNKVNPEIVDGQLQFNSDGNVRWQVYDMSGRRVGYGCGTSADLSYLAAGIYMLSAMMPDGQLIKSKIHKHQL